MHDFFGRIWSKKILKNIWNGWPKPWTKPLAKMQILPLFKFDILLSRMANSWKTFSGLFDLKKHESEKIANFWPKPWTKKKILPLFKLDIFIF